MGITLKKRSGKILACHRRDRGSIHGVGMWQGSGRPSKVGGFIRIVRFLPQHKKVNRKVQEEPQAEATVNPRHQEEEKEVTQINVCIANKQMHDKHNDQLPQASDQNANRTEETHRQRAGQDQTWSAS